MTDRTWCPHCEHWLREGIAHAEMCPHDGEERVYERLQVFTEDEIVAALEAIDEVDHVRMEWWHGPDDFRVQAYMTEAVESYAPLGAAGKTFDLRIWTVDWISKPTFFLVPAAGFQHVYEGAKYK